MTPNAASGPSRRSFLASTAVATAAVAGGVPLLSACGGSYGCSNHRATTVKYSN
jgi:putative aldouronate transport system substrate-binding protein